MSVAHALSSTITWRNSFRVPLLQYFRGAAGKEGVAVTRRRMHTTALLKRKKDSSVDWMDSEREVLVMMPVGEEITKRQLEVKFTPTRVTVKVNGEELIGGELDAEINMEECTWSIDADDNDQRQVQLVLAKKEYWNIWPFLFLDEAEGMDEVTEMTWMDIDIDGEPQGRITFGLFGKAVPQTTENFMMLSVSTLGTSPESGKELTYKGNAFHRIIPGFMIQGGDITHGDGTGGESIYDGGNFDDENFLLKHTEPGMLSMANAGPNTNNSQFFITSVPCPHLDGKHVVFGKVLSGMDIVKKMEACGSRSGAPTKKVVIADCGEIYTEPHGDPDDISLKTQAPVEGRQ